MTTSIETPPGQVECWADLSGQLPDSRGWHHSGVHVDPEGRIHCAHPEGYALLTITPQGTTRRVDLDFAELHGIASGGRAGLLAIADPGWRMHEIGADVYQARTTPGRAALIRDLDGSVHTEFERPTTPTYDHEDWRPTSIAVTPAGEVWIADGYGQDRIHRFTRDGRHLTELHALPDGTVLDCPHALITRAGAAGTELVVADRGNHRLVILDEAGNLLRTVGQDHLDSPSGLAVVGGELYVTELHGGIAHFGADDAFLGTLENGRARSETEAAWPNRPGARPGTLHQPVLAPATLNSPHGLAVHEGALYLTDWVIGGRLARIDLRDPGRSEAAGQQPAPRAHP